MGYNQGGYRGGNGGGGFRGGNGGGGGNFQPKPGSGTLFVKNDKSKQSSPDYDGYFIVEFDVRAGEKIKLVGWDKDGPKGHMINLKMGRERQGAPGFGQGGQGSYRGQQGGYQQPPQNQGGYRQAPQQDRGYNNPNPTYGNRGGYQQPPSGQQTPGAYQGGGYGGQPAQTYQPPAATQLPTPGPVGATPPPAAGAPNYAFPPPADTDLPF